ncbi:TPA: tail fiber protein [Enterobacter cancerogenus]|nr:tail fiber protein [Enterobacter cancerogenus]HDR2163647.1 tail fiber protein [Enterobacter cancerogenus]HDR2266785.1 tail fiber protein [Enterobacter cancerogenus]
MTVKFKTVITKAGAEKLAAATVPNGKKVNFTAMAVGDGGGQLPTPNATQTKLVNEVWRHALNKISQDHKNKNYVIAELLIPPETGGFWMREMGLYDDAGTLIAVGNMAESYKPTLAEGSGRAQTVRMVIMVSDINTVELTIDTTTVMASQDYVDGKLAEHEQSRRHPDATLTAKGFTQLSNATDSASEVLAATPKAVKAAYDLANGKYTAQDATTAQKGIVQLSSATDSSSEVLAATPKAVKVAYDLANGKYTAKDATTLQKGIVQLSSAIDSTSETLAATPKAVKTAYDNAEKRFPITGGWLSGSTGIKTELGSVLIGVGTTDIYVKNEKSNCYLQLANNGDLKYDGKMIYHEGKKPAASDVDAVSATNGGTFKREVNFQSGLSVRSSTGIISGNDAAGFTSNNMLLKSWFGIGFYCTLTGSEGVTGYINTRNGQLEMKGQIIPGNYTNFDGRFYTKSLADNTFQPKGSYGKPNSYKVSGNILWTQDGDTKVIRMTGQAGSTSHGTRITFPFAFASKCYSVHLNSVATSGAGTALAANNINTTGFNLHIAGGGAVALSWTAEGI